MFIVLSVILIFAGILFVGFANMMKGDMHIGRMIVMSGSALILMVLLVNPNIFLNLMNQMINLLVGGTSNSPDLKEPKSESTPSQKPTESPTPEQPAEPINIDWNLILIIGACVIGLIVVIAVCYLLHSRWKAGEAERKAKQEKTAALKAAREENKQIWSGILDEGDKLVSKWAKLSTDIESIVQCPIYARVDNPLTNQVIRAVTSVRIERRENLIDWDNDPWTTTYGVAVKELRDDLRVLESTAQFYHLNAFSTSELKLLEQAQKLLNTARNQSSAPNERQMAYARLERIFSDLNLSLDDTAKETLELETQALKQITAG